MQEKGKEQKEYLGWVGISDGGKTRWREWGIGRGWWHTKKKNSLGRRKKERKKEGDIVKEERSSEGKQYFKQTNTTMY